MSPVPPRHSAEFNQKLSQLRDDYLGRLYTQSDEIQALGRTLLDGSWEADGAQHLYMLVHKVAGSAGSFGFHELSQAARQLEQMLLPYMSGAGPAWGESRTMIERTLSDVARLAGRGGQSPVAHARREEQPTPSERPVFVVEDDAHLAHLIRARLESTGYRVQLFEDIRELECAAEIPRAVIMDVILPEGEDAGLQAITRLRREHGSVPVVVISVRDDAPARLAALRAGAVRYLVKPLDVERLVDVLDGLVGRIEAAPVRVLLVDDDPDLLAHGEAVLQAAGMEVRTVARPIDALDAARSLRPDVIVLDVYMPEISGLELAALLREDDAFSQTPILFLSAEADISRQLAALDLGGDEFLVKPVMPDHLVAAIRARGKRSRHMQRLVGDMRRAVADKASAQFALDQHAIVSATDAAGNILYANHKFVEISGYTEAELIGKNHRLLKSGMHPDTYYEDMWRTISSGEVWHGTLCNRRRNGDPYWVESTIVPFLDENGLPYRYVSVRTDVSAIMEVEERLRAERDFSDAAINAIPGTFYVLGPDGQLLRTNESTTGITGYSVEEISRMGALAFFAEADHAKIAAAIKQGFETGRVDVEASLLTKSGERIPFYFQAVRFEFEGTPALIGTGTDISVLKRAQNALEYSESRLRLSQDYANIGTWDWNIQTGDLFWSDRIAPLFGYGAGKLETTYENFLAAVHPDDRQSVIDAVTACLERGEKYDIEHRCIWPDRTVHWLLERGDVVRDDNGSPLHMLGVVQDITARKTAELALHESRGRLEQAQRIAALGNWEANLVTGELHWSEQIFHIFGYDPATFTPSVEAFYEAVHPDDMEKVRASEQRAQETGVHDVVHRIVRPDGKVRWVHELAELKFDAERKPVRLIGIVQDVTALKEAEIELTRAKESAERANQAKSDFLSSMSHELRTPMNAILGFAQLLEMDRSLSVENKDSVTEILKAGHHLLELINDVLDLAKVEAGRVHFTLEAVACHELCEDSVHLVQGMAQERGITLDAATQPWVVRADRTRLKQAVVNLLSNAIKYNRPGGSVRLDVVEGGLGRVCIRVRDNGPGIALERQAELFQAFNRLGAERTEVEGTGIGLVITRRLIEMMGGRIGIDSVPGVGSTFWIEVPRDDAEVPPAALAPSARAASPMVEADTTVLYIEDNPANVRLVNQLLARRPRVKLLTAHTPSLGLDLAVARAPDLVLLDINLPGIDGYEVLKRLRALPGLADVPIVAVTANAMPHDIQRGLAAGFSEYLTKPLDIPRFFHVVDHLLGHAADESGHA